MDGSGASQIGFFWEADAVGGLVSADAGGAEVSSEQDVALALVGRFWWEAGASGWEIWEASGKDEGGRMKDEPEAAASVRFDSADREAA